jgi:hypothetical protein
MRRGCAARLRERLEAPIHENVPPHRAGLVRRALSRFARDSAWFPHARGGYAASVYWITSPVPALARGPRVLTGPWRRLGVTLAKAGSAADRG